MMNGETGMIVFLLYMTLILMKCGVRVKFRVLIFKSF